MTVHLRDPLTDRYFNWLTRHFYCPGYEPDDVAQEARIAAWLAPGHERTAAWRAVCEIVRRETQRRPQFAEQQDIATGDVTVDTVLARERLAELAQTMRERLTPLERRAVVHVANGGSYKGDKSIDNALYYARRKLAA